ncbi:lipoprotein 17-related variable surface protein [Mycoplasmopsis primatum]|uniref:lipoprotein 17-related variable surface protein n=1 Tax=Mycoplasmopsis primatum TaxID=55604 RepID=UPI000496E890|nr:lipoprotein 17-related variable surface protein [Mycoplasmopsis primatum]
MKKYTKPLLFPILLVASSATVILSASCNDSGTLSDDVEITAEIKQNLKKKNIFPDRVLDEDLTYSFKNYNGNNVKINNPKIAGYDVEKGELIIDYELVWSWGKRLHKQQSVGGFMSAYSYINKWFQGNNVNENEVLNEKFHNIKIKYKEGYDPSQKSSFLASQVCDKIFGVEKVSTINVENFNVSLYQRYYDDLKQEVYVDYKVVYNHKMPTDITEPYELIKKIKLTEFMSIPAAIDFDLNNNARFIGKDEKSIEKSSVSAKFAHDNLTDIQLPGSEKFAKNELEIKSFSKKSYDEKKGTVLISLNCVVKKPGTTQIYDDLEITLTGFKTN